MTPSPFLLTKFFAFTGALSFLMARQGWWRKGSRDEDDVVAEAADLVLGALSDADDTRSVEVVAGRNWRDQVTVGEAMEMHEERELRRFGRRN